MEFRRLYYSSYERDLELVSKNGLLLQYIEKQNVEFCLAAIKNNPKALKFAQKQTREMCLHH